MPMVEPNVIKRQSNFNFAYILQGLMWYLARNNFISAAKLGVIAQWASEYYITEYFSLCIFYLVIVITLFSNVVPSAEVIQYMRNVLEIAIDDGVTAAGEEQRMPSYTVTANFKPVPEVNQS